MERHELRSFFRFPKSILTLFYYIIHHTPHTTLTMDHTEVKYLMDTWDLTQSQSQKLHNGFQKNTIDANTLCQILNEDITDFITLDDAQDAIKFKSIDNKLTLSGFEEFMNERLPELDTPLQRTFTEHPYIDT